MRAVLIKFVALAVTCGMAAYGAAPAGNLSQVLKQKLAEQAISTLLNNQLPLKLDANSLYPTVATPPGEPFEPLPLQLSAEAMNEPLPPGDYVIRALAFCSEYSVHCPAAGVAYELGPLQGKAATAIATLLRRGIIEKGRSPHELQAVSWTIQAGVTYAKMPKLYQAIVDDVIPEYRNQLGGDFIQNIEDIYQANAKAAGLPPLEKLLASLGKAGQLALTANRQRQAILRQNTNDQLRDQTLFAGQERRIAPVKAAEGPWTVRIPGRAYVRYRVVGGNMAANNEIQIRILPQVSDALAWNGAAPEFMFASYPFPRTSLLAQVPAPGSPAPTVRNLTSDAISYSVSRAAQVLYFVPTPSPSPVPPMTAAIGKVSRLEGTATLTRNGVTKPLSSTDQISMNDTITTGGKSRTHITFADGTEFTLGPNTKLTVDDFVYDPTATNGRESYDWLGGAFRYVSGLIGKNHDNEDRAIQTPVGQIGIRGTTFIARYDAKANSVELQLVSGTVVITPKKTKTAAPFSAPVTLVITPSTITSSPLVHDELEASRVQELVR